MPPTFLWINESWGRALKCTPLLDVAPHFFTTRDLGLKGPHGCEAWAAIASSIDAPVGRVFRVRQVHGCGVEVIDASTPPQFAVNIPEADILVSADPDSALAVRTADCVPLLIADRRSGAVAAAHAGWRGIAADVPKTAVAVLEQRYTAYPSHLIAAIGPSIGPCCYLVGPELIGAFDRAGHSKRDVQRWFTVRDGLRLDLWRATANQLEAAGIDSSNIHLAGLCTACHTDLFPSYRREGAAAGRIAAVIRSPRR